MASSLLIWPTVQRLRRTSNQGILDPILHYNRSVCPQLFGTKMLCLKIDRGTQLLNPNISYVVVIVVVVMVVVVVVVVIVVVVVLMVVVVVLLVVVVLMVVV